ncbi:hypothetical protein EHI8A_037830 [Entamoeba histolytica HM-1:IMSS-B]|uniref:YokE-like PH domain-containing protein n=6 Tax=Entamoeba histolytica TaxID=5759 RepID=C4M0V1_ENTH1|nr:hypothetical protein EHI_100300 [Entamoeba histolytica HM-1:IMSS]EMD47357.1 Hypothetical protein EHI5A_055950 [Entamoeba histolytica KU27]EMH75085.1 hypothetical protein EHI8A_037830 [Entamoeba histolytica HM-1:IMSS-B]EMS13287.1 hypothetical protein KM1_069370 [Entamoeba histolytica HM-3:IMSS]ENY63226.1 hypothetical protein EHI7A_038970 [Entamoeba histolytica HM-1:IMSS-A]GAT94792.1 hypothetical protein CL6EHI_100300 [Entamoeba histolytica]|eukprot:XP_651705.1 hypothetical protein EHI_100300 [Entamoeba histolytica HM-1:IMSS]
MEFVEVEHINSIIDQFIQKKYIHLGGLFYVYQINRFNKKKTRVIQCADGQLMIFSIEAIVINKEIYDIRLIQEVQMDLSNTLFLRLNTFQLLIKTSAGNCVIQSLSTEEMDILIEGLMESARSLSINSTTITCAQFYYPSSVILQEN